MKSSLTPRRLYGFLIALIAVLFISTLIACWIIPYRLRFEPGGSSYTFGFIGDEYAYAYRIQPLLPHATASNPVNGFGDKNLISQMFLEDALRAFLTLTRIPVNLLYWIWRILFPCCLAALLIFLAKSAIAGYHRWRTCPRLTLAGAGLVFIYCGNALTMMRPEQNFIDRVPGNAEYPLSIL